MSLDELLELIRTYEKLYVVQIHERNRGYLIDDEEDYIDKLYELKEYNKIDRIKHIYVVHEYTIDGLFIPKEENSLYRIIFEEFDEEEFIIDEYTYPYSVSSNDLYKKVFLSRQEAKEAAFKLNQLP